MAYVPPTTHVTLLATLQRERLLPAPGEVNVQENQRVDASAVIARTTIAKRHRLVDVARQLGVPPKQVEAFMKKHDGDTVQKGEPLASRRELFFPNDVLSPADGTLLAVWEGKALIAVAEPPVEVRAGMLATVIKVAPDYGATLETTGALVEGVWGNGQETFGVIRVVGAPADALKPELIEVDLRGTIVGVGILEDTAAFGKLTEVAVRGLVIGSLHADLIPDVQALPFPVVVVEGFGAQGFSQPAYTLLAGNSDREAWVNAQPWNRLSGRRPEIIIPLPSPSQPPGAPVDGEALKEGQRVRIVRGAGTGRVGQVVGLSPEPMLAASGVRTCLASVKLEETEDPPLPVPFANLEILE